MKRAIVAKGAMALVLLACVPAAAQAAPGDPDPGFGANGLVTTDFELGSDDGARDIAVDSSDRLVAVGRSDGRFAIARYTSAGALDPSFGGGDGLLTMRFGPGTQDGATGVAIDAAGRIVVAGSSDSAVAIARFTSTGALDPSFSGDGKLTTALGSDADAYAADLAIDAAGRIVVGATGAGFADFAILRFTPDGSLDPSFGGSGLVTTDFGGSLDYLAGLDLDGQGRIVAGGYSTGNFGDYALARYLSTGALDPSFSGDGRVLTDVSGLGSLDYLEDVAVDHNGRVLAAGHTATFGELSGHIAVLRYTVAGAGDPSFGELGDGVVKVVSDSMALGVGVDEGNRPLVVGWTRDAGDVLIRLRTDGLFDPGFGGGIAPTPFTGGAIVTDSAKRIAIAGSHYIEATDTSDFAVARYLGEAPPAPPASGLPPAGRTAIRPLRPTTRIGRVMVNRRTATFRFSGRGSSPPTFQCKLDGGVFKRCRSPKTYRRLKPGWHVFRVRAVDDRGRKDPSPALKRFRVAKP